MNSVDQATTVASGGLRLTLHHHNSGPKDYTLFFPNKSLCAMQEQFGWLSVTDICLKIQSAWDPMAVTRALWAGTLHTNPEVKISDFDDMVVPKSQQYLVMVTITAAIQNSDVTEEDLEAFSEDLKMMDRAPDPKVVQEAVGMVVKQLLTDGIIKPSSGSSSNGAQPSASASPATPSGTSPDDSSIGSSAESESADTDLPDPPR